MDSQNESGEYIAAILCDEPLTYIYPDGNWTMRFEPATMNMDQNGTSLLVAIKIELPLGFRILCASGRNVLFDFREKALVQIRTGMKSLIWKLNGLPDQMEVQVNGIKHHISVNGQFSPGDRDHFFLGHRIRNEALQDWEQNDVSYGKVHGCPTEEIIEGFQFEDNVMSSLHVESQNVILLFGGTVSSDPQYIYLGIWRYEISKKLWTRIEGIEFNFTFCDVALTSNEDYVVIVGGRPVHMDPEEEYTTHDEIEMTEDRIFVLDIRDEKKYEMWMTSIQVGIPALGRSFGDKHHWGYSCEIIQGSAEYDNLLICGWIRRLFASDSFVEMELPAEIVHQLIGKFKRSDVLHWMLVTKDTQCSNRTSRAVYNAMSLREILSARDDEWHQTEGALDAIVNEID